MKDPIRDLMIFLCEELPLSVCESTFSFLEILSDSDFSSWFYVLIALQDCGFLCVSPQVKILRSVSLWIKPQFDVFGLLEFFVGRR